MSAMTAGEQFLEDFVSYEARGVPDKAGTDTKDGFDLVRMLPFQHLSHLSHRLLHAE